MGTQASLPIPTDADFIAAAKSSTTTTAKLSSLWSCDSQVVVVKTQQEQEQAADLRFTIPCKAWKDGTTTMDIPSLGVKLVAAEKNDKDKDKDKDGTQLLVVQTIQDDTVLALLREPADYPRPLEIYVPQQQQQGNNSTTKSMTYQGQTMTQVALVDKIRDSAQHVLRLHRQAPKPLLFRTDKCGDKALHDKIVHQVQHVQDKANKKGKTYADIHLCAYLQEQAATASWNIRVVASLSHQVMDPLLVLCFCLCVDRWAVRDAAFWRHASRVSMHNTGGRGLWKNIT